MSAILNQCCELREKIKRIANLESDALVANNLESVRAALAIHVQRSAALRGNLKVLKASEQTTPTNLPLPSQITGLLGKVETVRARLIEKRASLKQGNTWANCDLNAQQLVKQLNDGLHAAWGIFVRGTIANMSNFAAFRSLDTSKATFKEIDELNKNLLGKVSILPEAETDIQYVVEIGERLKRLVSNLDFGDPMQMPLGVQEFLKEATTGGASLASLSDEVFAWLRAREELLKSLKVIIGGGRP